jgi:hypothetical protein
MAETAKNNITAFAALRLGSALGNRNWTGQAAVTLNLPEVYWEYKSGSIHIFPDESAAQVLAVPRQW